MLTTIKINVKQKIKGNIVSLKAQRTDKKNIDLVTFFQPYIDKGMKLKKLHYTNNTGLLQARLSIN